MTAVNVKVSEVEVGDKILTTSGSHEVVRIVPIAIGHLPARQIHYVNRNSPERPFENVYEQVDHATISVEEKA